MAHHDRQRLRVADFLGRVRDELDRAHQDADLWREEADRERARIANMQTDTSILSRRWHASRPIWNGRGGRGGDE